MPAGSLPVIAMILGHVPHPAGGARAHPRRRPLLDMCRTTLNVVGDLAAAVYVARGEPVEEPGAVPEA